MQMLNGGFDGTWVQHGQKIVTWERVAFYEIIPAISDCLKDEQLS